MPFFKEAEVFKVVTLVKQKDTPSYIGNDIAQHIASRRNTTATPASSDLNLSENFINYYDSAELDTIPAPVQQWNIDRDRITKESLHGLSLEVTLWVDDLGTIRDMYLQNAEQLSVNVDWILNSLKLTTLAPATIRNRPVPCVITFSIHLGE